MIRRVHRSAACSAATRAGLAVGLLAGLLLWTADAAASPLNLEPGDVIDTIEWDALYSQGDGGVYTWDGILGSIMTNGRITSADVQRAPAFPPSLTSVLQTGVTFSFAADLISYNQSGTVVNAIFSGSASTDPDVTIIQDGEIILTGDFIGNFVFGGSILSPSLLSAGNIAVTGGHPALVAAIGSIAILELTASVFGFDPDLAVLAADGNIVNQNFTVEFSGTLRPANASPFVPEPTTAVLLGGGLLGLLAAGRRRMR